MRPRLGMVGVGVVFALGLGQVSCDTENGNTSQVKTNDPNEPSSVSNQIGDASADISLDSPSGPSLSTDQATCKPKTCGELKVNCGPQADGCGGIIQCGTCVYPEVCGGAGPSLCGKPNPDCVPITCAALNVNCGVQANGCGETIDCGMCIAPEICGGGGIPSVCGGGRPTVDGAPCAPSKTACAPGECGPQADGCGGLIQCGGCAAPDTCGGGGVPSVCGRKACEPTTCAKAIANCGPIGDGCGGLIASCGTCSAPDVCGGGGVPSVCGNKAFNPDACTPTKTACEPGDCGPIADGCGGLLSCGTCSAPETCGGGGVPSKCGGNGTCQPRTCAQAGATCGAIGNGCGGTITSCGTCSPPMICGGGGVPSVCGGAGLSGDGGILADGGTCSPKTTCGAGECGPVANGCGGLLQCGGCPGGQVCGAGGVPSQCATTSCVPRTCAELGANCGAAGDGCGSLIPNGCGGCPPGQICGGGGVPSQCGPLADGGTDDAGSCTTNLCQSQVRCGSGTTSVSGKIYAPNGIDPLFNAVIYVPNGTVTRFTEGVSCQQCGAELSGSPLVKAYSAPDGTFRLENVPVTSNVPFVIQLGKWRRQFKVNITAPCANTVLDPALTRMPKNHTEGDIPLTAITAGEADPLECVLRKIGIEDSEFTSPTGTGRFHLYRSNGGQAVGGSPSADTALWQQPATLRKYDLLILDCEGDAYYHPGADAGRNANGASSNQQNLIDYVNAGGRIYTSHYGYTWLTNVRSSPTNGPVPFSSVATFGTGSGRSSNVGNVDTSWIKGQAFAQWLRAIDGLVDGGTPGTPQIAIQGHTNYLRSIASSLGRGWVWVPDSGVPPAAQPMHYTFNAPVNVPEQQQCGRVMYSDFHVQANYSSGTDTFPSYCTSSSYASERILEFMLFDLAACIEPDNHVNCTPRTCQQLGIECGPAGDGCGNPIDCGTCPTGQTCGGGGVPSKCGVPTCHKTTCQASGAQCGVLADGCGGSIDCGTCASPLTCGGGGSPNKCGAASCTKRTCAQAGANCGPVADGCGSSIDCGACTPPETCGGGGVPSQCGRPCRPKTCSGHDPDYCGDIGDGCGNLIHCGACQAPLTCGGGGEVNVCGAASCTPRTCQQLGISCGAAGDGCGGQLDCGPCPPNCTPRTCVQAGATCGLVPDGCGSTLNCGVCTLPQTCGGGGALYQCGAPNCTPFTCQTLGVTCGPVGDGCGNLLDCGHCPSNCRPRTCADAGANCGQIADNCGNLLDCGTCIDPEKCGGNGRANVCGKPTYF